ncbi:MAG TPA: hypothetical protein VHZ24_21080 [Pirellulales bacterium]|jgi:hypothetical protein|nr:hypothetical protein [Pirellulales bacterium]
MATSVNYRQTPASIEVERALRAAYPRTPEPVAYQYNSVSIRARVIDETFAGKSMDERDAMVKPLLPDDVDDNMTVLLLLSPDEIAESLMNQEFESPRPSRL